MTRRPKRLFALPHDVDRAISMRAAKQRTTRTAVLVEALRVHLDAELAEIRTQSPQLVIDEEEPTEKSA